MTYQIQNPSPITIKGQSSVNGQTDSAGVGSGHSISPKLTGIPLANAPWQNNVKPVPMAIQAPTAGAQTDPQWGATIILAGSATNMMAGGEESKAA